MFSFIFSLGILTLAIILSVVMLIGFKKNLVKKQKNNNTIHKNEFDITATNPSDIGYYNPLNLNNPMNS